MLWRDRRSQEELQAVGIFAQPTDDAVHRGDPDVTVAQGNHFVSLKSKGQPDPAYELEVLHLPWRSWLQYERRAINTGRSYEANPNLRPSKNHHGMADYRRHLAGRLKYAFLLRLPLEKDLVMATRTVPSSTTRGSGTTSTGSSTARDCPTSLHGSLDTAQDEPFDPVEHERAANIGRLFVALEAERDEARRLADRPAPKPLRLRDDWRRIIGRTGRALRRRLGVVRRAR